ncbi:MAG: hypothetical protein NT080_02460 [Spirochaetes bacterium]|nr:hypothetical protein [Spirochaetota bacterium]
MNKVEQTILSSRTPEEYVDNSVKSRLSPVRKAALAREWMKKTGFARTDILHARNRHPYWKKKKMENSAERARKRLLQHDYSTGKPVLWNDELVGNFLDMSRTIEDGKYEHKDHELAEHFKTTIPSIQYMRRKLRLVRSILGGKVQRSRLVGYMCRSESLLRKGKDAVDEFSVHEKLLERKTGTAKTTSLKSARKTTRLALKNVRVSVKKRSSKPSAIPRSTATDTKKGTAPGGRKAAPRKKAGRKAR